MHPVLLETGGLAVWSFGIFVTSAFVLGAWLAVWQAGRAGIPRRAVLDILLACAAGALIGGRLAYVAVEWRYFAVNPLAALEVWKGGFVYFGGLAGAAFGVSRLRAVGGAYPHGVDALAPGLALGQAVGRLGCFLAGCCYGAACGAPWAVVYTDPRGLGPLGAAVHPSQLYESLGDAALAALLLYLLQRRKVGEGGVFGAYLALYAVLRFAVELTRGDPRGFIGPLSAGQIMAVPAFLAGLYILYISGMNERR